MSRTMATDAEKVTLLIHLRGKLKADVELYAKRAHCDPEEYAKDVLAIWISDRRTTYAGKE